MQLNQTNHNAGDVLNGAASLLEKLDRIEARQKLTTRLLAMLWLSRNGEYVDQESRQEIAKILLSLEEMDQWPL